MAITNLEVKRKNTTSRRLYLTWDNDDPNPNIVHWRHTGQFGGFVTRNITLPYTTLHEPYVSDIQVCLDPATTASWARYSVAATKDGAFTGWTNGVDISISEDVPPVTSEATPVYGHLLIDAPFYLIQIDSGDILRSKSLLYPILRGTHTYSVRTGNEFGVSCDVWQEEVTFDATFSGEALKNIDTCSSSSRFLPNSGLRLSLPSGGYRR